MMTSHLAPEVLKRALPHIARIKANLAEYEDEKRKAGGWLDYCKHGTYIGSWWGPDYLCGYCEDGDPMWIYRAAIRCALDEIEEQERPRRRIAALYDLLLAYPQHRTFINAELSRRA